MQKLTIIGSGVSGLSAGIIAARAGLNVEIYEKNPVPGGNCSAWTKDDYTIDNCLNIFYGSSSNSGFNQFWRELKVLNENSLFVNRSSLFTSELEGQSITLWRNINQTKEEMVALSPEDAEEIDSFIEFARFVQIVQFLNKKKLAPAKILLEIRKYQSYSKLIKTIKLYLNSSMEEIVLRFKHPLLQKLFSDFMGPQVEACWLPMYYGFFISGNGEVPEGGTNFVLESLVKEFESCGGKLYLNSPVKQIALGDKKMARGIFLEDESFIPADFIICACDPNYTFTSLLDKSFCPKRIEEAFDENLKCWSTFQVVFTVKNELKVINDTLVFDCEPVQVAEYVCNRLRVKNYRKYDSSIAPKGETVIQCSLSQFEKDFDYWKKMAKNQDDYVTKKNEVALEIQNRVIQRFPECKGKIQILEVITPYSYEKNAHSYYGSYFRFATRVNSPYAFLPYTVKGLNNVYTATQWLRYPGGVASAASVGIEVARQILKKLKVER